MYARSEASAQEQIQERLLRVHAVLCPVEDDRLTIAARSSPTSLSTPQRRPHTRPNMSASSKTGSGSPGISRCMPICTNSLTAGSLSLISLPGCGKHRNRGLFSRFLNGFPIRRMIPDRSRAVCMICRDPIDARARPLRDRLPSPEGIWSPFMASGAMGACPPAWPRTTCGLH
jgi:hypothetical protein